MTKLPVKPAPQCTSAHRGCHLETARRQQAIAVVAHMACNIVKTHATSCQQESAQASLTGIDHAPE